MADRLRYELRDSLATIALDDGKVNALSLGMIGEIGAALDRAEKDGAAVVLLGRPGVFSAGFDLATIRSGGVDAPRMLIGGFELAARMYAFSHPIVAACTGHALAMGAFLLLASDYRVGAEGAFRIAANEVSIGLTMPYFAIEICRARLTPACFQRAMLHSEIFAPHAAREAGFIDQVAAPAELEEQARVAAARIAALPRATYTATKLRVREAALAAMRRGIAQDAQGFGLG
jgi:enoyl-CoA hydratase